MGGRTSTHVANAYHQTVYAMVDAERQRVVEASASVNGSAISEKYEYNIIKAGYTRILPQKYERFDVDMKGTNTAYISVFYIDETTQKPCWVADALARQEDKSVIVTADGMLVDAKHGTIWQQED